MPERQKSEPGDSILAFGGDEQMHVLSRYLQDKGVGDACSTTLSHLFGRLLRLQACDSSLKPVCKPCQQQRFFKPCLWILVELISLLDVIMIMLMPNQRQMQVNAGISRELN